LRLAQKPNSFILEFFMPRLRSSLSAIAIGSATFASLSCGSDEKTCSTVGCDANVTIITDLSMTFEQLQKSTISVCRNDVCLMGSFSTLNARPAPGTGVIIPISADANAHASVIVSLPASGIGLSLDVYWNSVDPTQLQNGDVYRLVVLDEAGLMQVSIQETVPQYEESHPNGPDCAPTCRQFTIDKRTP
jgi:hypothetical protein